MPRKPVARGLATVAMLLAMGSGAIGCTLMPELTRVVVKVPSADTLTLDDGTDVVLIGALPPVNLDAASVPATPPWPPAELSRQALETLTAGKSVGLAFAGRRRDRYARHLAHVFLERDGERIWVQANLIASGHARAYALQGSTACLNGLLDHERSARAVKAGHWATGIFQDQDAHAPRALARYHGTFQTIEGRVDHISTINGQTVLDFNPDHRQGFSVWIGPTTRRSTSAVAAGLIGRRVRVRGWIELRRMPRLTLATAAEIEPLDSPAASTGSAPRAP